MQSIEIHNYKIDIKYLRREAKSLSSPFDLDNFHTDCLLNRNRFQFTSDLHHLKKIKIQHQIEFEFEFEPIQREPIQIHATKRHL